ncbi:MAG: hypothetical protein XD95_0642 [Microgenomates bacterium 39_7]|nr:MAG: hypothetical protein XD95_0642 [Microgenomates bacterium 39_7]
MITQKQVQELAKQHQRDQYSIYREYLQSAALTQLFSLENSNQLIFKGGTALRLIYQSPRFSEDLDFNSNTSLSKTKLLIKQLSKQLQLQIPNLYFKFIPSVAGLTAKLYLPLKISSQDLTVKLDFSFREKLHSFNKTTLQTSFPIQSFSLIQVMSKEEILAEKIGAILSRDQVRDIYDLWWLLSSDTFWDDNLISSKLTNLDLKVELSSLIEKINSLSTDNFSKRLSKFLPLNDRKMLAHIPQLLTQLIKRNIKQ